MHELLLPRLEAMKSRGMEAGLVDRLGKILPGQGDWDLLRINPFRFARTHELPEERAVDLFVHAARAGIMDFDYNLLCPRCGGVARSHHELDGIEGPEFYCAVCDASAPATLDDQVEVSFTLHPSIRKLEVDGLADLDAYRRFNFSANYLPARPLQELRREIMKALVILEPNSSRRVHLKSGRQDTYQLVSIERNSSVFIELGRQEGRNSGTIDIQLAAEGFEPRRVSTQTTECDVVVSNLTRSRTGFIVVAPDIERILTIVAQEPTVVERFLTAKVLLNNQTFRDLFRIQHLSSRLNLNIKSLTILFTDLRGSTEMYDRAGDVFAYALVQEHFRILTDIVRRHNGAIIKTMGDAIMATFSNPRDGLLASLEMMTGIQRMNEEVRRDGYEIGLKVGLHEGPALAVMRDEQLDYFGQTVNIAARVQGLAQAGEIWLTEAVYAAPGLPQEVQASGYGQEQREASLKGVGQSTIVHRLFR